MIKSDLAQQIAQFRSAYIEMLKSAHKENVFVMVTMKKT